MTLEESLRCSRRVGSGPGRETSSGRETVNVAASRAFVSNVVLVTAFVAGGRRAQQVEVTALGERAQLGAETAGRCVGGHKLFLVVPQAAHQRVVARGRVAADAR